MAFEFLDHPCKPALTWVCRFDGTYLGTVVATDPGHYVAYNPDGEMVTARDGRWVEVSRELAAWMLLRDYVFRVGAPKTHKEV